MTSLRYASRLASAQEALGRYAWADAFDAFTRALDEQRAPEAYEGLSWAAWWRNDTGSLFHAREAAYRLYCERNDARGAARMAMWIACDHADFRGELSLASGWRQRAQRLLETVPLSAEHGWERLLAGDTALLYEGDTQTARSCAARVLEIGRRLEVPDFAILPLALDGLALVEEGTVHEGMKLLDEAAVLAIGDTLTQPFWACWTICYLLFACERVRDYGRATEWCERLRELAERHDMLYGLGICRVHYASILVWRGDWEQAETQLTEATSVLETTRAPWAAEAAVRLAELRMKQGRYEEAVDLFDGLEWHPHALLGRAELALDTGKPKDAEEFAERALRQLPDTGRHLRASALEVLVRAQALLGQRGRAAGTLARLHELCGEMTLTVPLKAATAYCSGMVALADRDHERARTYFEDAVTLFERAGAPYETARARLELAGALVALGRSERAAGEARTAGAVLQRLHSRIHSQRADALLQEIERKNVAISGPEARLTARQRQVLRLVAHGRSDRQIAEVLAVSEHTVHRHVANILQRLDAPNRTAAATFAAGRGLI